MIGKPEWFCARKFGWGLGLKTKESVVYVIAAVALMMLATMLPVQQEYRLAAMGAVVLVLVADVLILMPKVYAGLDEREERHQLMAERNATFVALVMLMGIAIYYSGIPALGGQLNQEMAMVPILVVVGMALAKGLTLMKMEREG